MLSDYPTIDVNGRNVVEKVPKHTVATPSVTADKGVWGYFLIIPSDNLLQRPLK